MNRTQKIENIDLLMTLTLADFPDAYEHSTVLTSMKGPHIEVKTDQYEATVLVDFAGSVVRFVTYGYVHRFADATSFIAAFRDTLKAPSPACAALAEELGGNTMGNSVLYNSGTMAFYMRETQHGFELNANNEKVTMSAHDIVKMIKKA